MKSWLSRIRGSHSFKTEKMDIYVSKYPSMLTLVTSGGQAQDDNNSLFCTFLELPSHPIPQNIPFCTKTIKLSVHCGSIKRDRNDREFGGPHSLYVQVWVQGFGGKKLKIFIYKNEQFLSLPKHYRLFAQFSLLMRTVLKKKKKRFFRLETQEKENIEWLSFGSNIIENSFLFCIVL